MPGLGDARFGLDAPAIRPVDQRESPEDQTTGDRGLTLRL